MTPENRALKVLMADDQPDVLAALRLLLKSEGFETRCVNSPRAFQAAMREERYDLLLMDLNYSRDTTSGQEGLDLLDSLQQIEAAPPTIVMTAWGSIELAVEAMRRGAVDFVTKPWENTRLLETLRKHAGRAPRQDTTEVRPASGDLGIARRVQQRLLPRMIPELSTIECAAECVQAGAVGGDYYDFLELGDGRTLFVLADVCGKGVPAALLMASLQATLRNRFLPAPDRDLATLVRDVNRTFFQLTEPEYFATVFLGVYDEASGNLRYVNCGHTAPVLLRRNGAVERLDSTATVLGAFSAFDCVERGVQISPGDLVAVWSDGITEARRVDQEQFGTERLVEVLRASSAATVSGLLRSVFEAVAAFSDYEQEDDLTLLVIRGRARRAFGHGNEPASLA